MTLDRVSDTGRHTSHSRVRERYWSICKHAVSSEMRPRSVGFGGRFVGRGFVAKGVTFLDFTLKRPLVVHIDEPRPRLMSSTSPFRTDAPRSGLGREFCGRFTLQYGILLHMAVTASCWALLQDVVFCPHGQIDTGEIKWFWTLHTVLPNPAWMIEGQTS